MISHGAEASKQLPLLPQLQNQCSDWLLATSTAGSYTGAPPPVTPSTLDTVLDKLP